MKTHIRCKQHNHSTPRHKTIRTTTDVSPWNDHVLRECPNYVVVPTGHVILKMVASKQKQCMTNEGPFSGLGSKQDLIISCKIHKYTDACAMTGLTHDRTVTKQTKYRDKKTCPCT